MYAYLTKLSKISLSKSSRYFYSHEYPPAKDLRQVFRFLLTNMNSKQKVQKQGSFRQTRKWLHEVMPMILSNYNKINQYGKYYQLFTFCQNFNFYRSELFDAVEKDMHNSRQSDKYSLGELSKIYIDAINFHHKDKTKNFYPSLRKAINKRVLDMQAISKKAEIPLFHYIFTLFLDRNISSSQKQQIINQLSPCIIRSIKQFDPNITLHKIVNIHQLTQLYKIQLFPQLKQFIFKNYKESDKLQANIRNIQNWSIKNSTFQKIFTRILSQIGYNFDHNLRIKGNQYDINVKSIYKVKNCHLANIDINTQFTAENIQKISKLPSFNLRDLKQYALSKQIQYTQKYTKLPHNVILNLNGHMHYIDNGTSTKMITRNQQFKYQKLALHGISRYNIVQYQEWEIISKYNKNIEKYIHDKINNSLLVANIGK